MKERYKGMLGVTRSASVQMQAQYGASLIDQLEKQIAHVAMRLALYGSKSKAGRDGGIVKVPVVISLCEVTAIISRDMYVHKQHSQWGTLG